MEWEEDDDGCIDNGNDRGNMESRRAVTTTAATRRDARMNRLAAVTMVEACAAVVQIGYLARKSTTSTNEYQIEIKAKL